MKFAAILIALWVTMSAQYAHAYQVSCSGSPLTATITSVLGEPRPASVGIPDRFHGGVDVTECNSLNSVQAIEGGTVRTTTACGGSTCIRVVASNGHAFDYVHIDPTVSINATVTAGQTLGTIVSGGDHLHLNEIQPLGTNNFRVNPQRPGALVFSDGDQPDFVPTTIGAVSNQSIIPVQEGTATPFTYRSSAFYVKGNVDVFINARDGSSRKGLYEVGARPRTSGYLFSGQINLTFNNLHDNGGSAGEVQTLYYYRNSDSDTFIGTNKKINDNPAQQVQNATWATDVELPGAVQLCGNLTDYPQGHSLEECVNVVIDRSAPTITMTNAGGTVADGGATSTPTITIQGSDSGGIYSIKLEGGVSYSSTNYVSGVQTTASNQFPDSGTLDDGSYVATVTDLAGNSAQAAFEIDSGASIEIDPTPDHRDGSPPPGGGATNFSCLIFSATNPESGICQLWVTPGSTTTFRRGPENGFDVGDYCELPQGTYTITAVGCSGAEKHRTIYVDDEQAGVVLTVGGAVAATDAEAVPASTIETTAYALSLGVNAIGLSCSDFTARANSQELSCTGGGGVALGYSTPLLPPPVTTIGFSLIKNTPGSISGVGMGAHFGIQLAHTLQAGGSGLTLNQGLVMTGSAEVAGVPSQVYSNSLHSSTLTVISPFSEVVITTRVISIDEEQARLSHIAPKLIPERA